MTNKKLVRRCNALARKFYADEGYVVRKSFKFYDATHPHERACWAKAVIAYDHIKGTSVTDALDELWDDELDPPEPTPGLRGVERE